MEYLKLLIADDEENIRNGLKYILDWEELGYKVCGEAANGKEAIQQIIDLNPDLVIQDIKMPGYTGIEVINGSEGNVLANKNNIRVYPIDVVKGMEFDVVFFHNIDKVSADPDLVKRFIYVGVSRAAFFLGVTMNKEMPEIGQYLQKNKKWDKI